MANMRKGVTEMKPEESTGNYSNFSLSKFRENVMNEEKEERKVGQSVDRSLPNHPKPKDEGVPGGANFFRKLKESEEKDAEVKQKLKANFRGLI